MRIYLDTCCLNRPFDDQSQARVALEAEAVLSILSHCETGTWTLVRSTILDFEVSQIRDSEKRASLEENLRTATVSVPFTEDVESRAEELEAVGLAALDALHLASAEQAGADVLCTCDDRFLKKCRTLSSLRVKVDSPTRFIEEHSP